MKRFLTLLLLVVGCAGDKPTAQRAIDTARSVMVGVDIAAETAAPGVVEARDILVEICRTKDLETPQERELCMGPLAQPLGPVAAEASEAYDALLEDLERLERALSELTKLKAAADQVRKEAPRGLAQ